MTLPDRAVSHVYFIRPLCGGPIKIGCSAHPETRLPSYAHWSPVPLEIIATVRAGPATESALHHRFAAARLHHEWFSPVPELLDLIEYAKEYGTIPGIIPNLDLSEFRGAFSGWKSDLRGVIERTGIARREIAERAGVTRATVGMWITYPSERCAGVIAAIAAERGIHLTAQDFFVREEPAPRKRRRARKPQAEASA